MNAVNHEELKIVLVDRDQLIPYPGNARRGNVNKIAESITENGYYDPIKVQRSTGYVVAGNHRLQALELLNWPVVPVIYLDIDDTRARLILLADNKASDDAVYDDPALVALLKETQIMTADENMPGSLFTNDDLAEILRRMDGFVEDAPEPDAGTETVKNYQFLVPAQYVGLVDTAIEAAMEEDDGEGPGRRARAFMRMCERYI